MIRADVVVIGGGAMGSAAAWWLARRGRDVVLLEQFERGHTRGSSHGGSRIFRLAYADPVYVGLAQEALPLWRELEDESGRSLLITTGGVDHGPLERLRPVADALAARGATVEWLSPVDATSRWPGLRFDEHVVYQPDAGCCRADDTVRTLHERAAGHGALLRFGERAEVLERSASDGVDVVAGDETYRARVAIVAAGSWAPRAVPEPGRAGLPAMRVTQEQVFHFRPRDEGTGAGSWPSFIHHRAPWRYGLLTPGEGVKVAEHGSGPETDPDQRSFIVDPEGRRRVCEYVARWLPGVDPVPVSETTCLYTTTPTEDFVVDRLSGAPVVVAAGFSGHGFKFAPLIGRMLADLAEGLAGAGHPRFALPRS